MTPFSPREPIVFRLFVEEDNRAPLRSESATSPSPAMVHRISSAPEALSRLLGLLSNQDVDKARTFIGYATQATGYPDGFFEALSSLTTRVPKVDVVAVVSPNESLSALHGLNAFDVNKLGNLKAECIFFRISSLNHEIILRLFATLKPKTTREFHKALLHCACRAYLVRAHISHALPDSKSSHWMTRLILDLSAARRTPSFTACCRAIRSLVTGISIVYLKKRRLGDFLRLMVFAWDTA